VTGLRVALLCLGVLGVQVRPRRVPPWVAPVGAAVVGLVVGAIPLDRLDDSLRPFAAPLAFLLLAVPMAAMLDRIGLFAAAAARVGRTGRLAAGLWVLGAVVTTLVNLDAAVVLLTPLYIRIARRTGQPTEAYAFQPVLLALFASSALPVSNLTNLIAADHLHLDAADFLVHLAPASLAATVVGYLGWRHHFGVRRAREPAASRSPAVMAGADELLDVGPAAHDPRAWRVGGPVVVGLLLGFTLGDALGVPAWAVVAVADVVLVVVLRDVPWRRLPVGTAALAAGLGVLAAAAAPALHLDRWVGHGEPGPLRVVALVVGSAVAANLVDNLPALLALLPALAAAPASAAWPVLAGVNIGPIGLTTGALATLLWMESSRQAGVHVTARDFARVGIRVGVPALVAATAVLVCWSLG
jgi:arsenical pump membrane protein